MSGILTFGKQKSLNLTWWPSLSFVQGLVPTSLSFAAKPGTKVEVHIGSPPMCIVSMPQPGQVLSSFHSNNFSFQIFTQHRFAWCLEGLYHILVWLVGIVLQGQMLCPAHVNFIQSHYLNFVLPCYISECSLFVLMVWEGRSGNGPNYNHFFWGFYDYLQNQCWSTINAGPDTYDWLINGTMGSRIKQRTIKMSTQLSLV